MDCRLPDILEAQRRIFGDNTTTAIAGHTYMSAWPSWPFLVRPVWYLFDKIGDDRIAAIVLLGNPLVLWPALAALAVCLRDWIVTRRRRCIPDPGVLFRALSRLGAAAAHARISVLLSAVGDDREPGAGLRAAARQQPALAVMGVCRGRIRRLCRDAADLGGVRRNVDGDVQPADDFPELDLRRLAWRMLAVLNPPAAGRRIIFGKPSLRRGLGIHVDDLNAAVDRVDRRVRVLWLVLAVADGDEIGAVDAVLLDQETLDRIGAAFGEVLVVGLAADRVGVTGDDEGRALQAGVRERLAEFLRRGIEALADIGRIVVELDIEIDLRLGRRDLRDFLALAKRERSGLAVAQGCRRN